GAHEILPEPDPKPSSPDALMARTHGAQVDETDKLDISGFGDPAEHATAMAVDAVPQDLTDKAADLIETSNPVELGHAYRHLVPADLRPTRAGPRVDEPRLAGGGPYARIALHPLHQQLEVADRQVQVHV